MHEFSIMQSTLELAEKSMRASGGARIHRIRIRIGSLSGVVPEALNFAFEALKTGTPAAEAELEIENIPAVCWCSGCATEFSATDRNYECPICRQPSGQLRQGLELELASLEIS